MQTIKALTFFDLDGTLLDEHSKITPEIAEAMVQLRKNGVMPIIATGRTNCEIQDTLDKTGINSVISMNGQYVLFDGKEIYSSQLSPETCAKMLKLTQANGHDLGFYNANKIAVTQHNSLVKKTYNLIHSDLPEIQPDFYEKEPVNMLLVLSEDQTTDPIYFEAFPDLTFFRNGPYSIDTIAGDGSKGNGVRKLIENLGLEDVPTYAFGDGSNDIDLFLACENRIAMGNAIPQLKEIATHITTKNTDHGIVNALNHFHLL
ncbi:Cof-type HAD-IIB family hydrolase [Vagococcus entomophilus]|uniref:HAD family hydrolase n=1 Tax=Vagococcus entomophilus TaxID=1160095 RepID=A0A430AKW8_9ENTE|nr:Cof-type HAD-IIB family hydrolase [Vagococcus entomophilus]RSU08735.1 HAD family hydrolase [Vagococcus entomophilus]